MRKFSEIRAKDATTEVGMAAARVALAEEIEAYCLGEIREFVAMTQQQLAALLGVNQPAVSKLEHASDCTIGRLRTAVEALGGTLVIEVRFDDITMPLRFGSAA